MWASVDSKVKELRIAFGGATSAGIKPRNEDAFAALQPSSHVRQTKGVIACIADGVSSSDNAQRASETSVTTFIQDYLSTPETWKVKMASARVLSALNSWLYYQGQVALTRHNSLVTTFTSVIFKSTTAHILHAGDSRIYRLRQGELVQLSQDHALLQHDGRAVLTRALGMESLLKVDYQQRSIRNDDLFVLTTDGFHEFISHAELREQLQALGTDDGEDSGGKNARLEAAAQQLLDKAGQNESDDNITCLLIRIIDVPLEDIDEAHRHLTRLKIPPVLKPGVTLDDYKIIRVLHSGTRSHLYLAQHPRYRHPFVLKMPSENFAEDAQYLEGFFREQWVGKRVNDPLVMKIVDPPADTKFLYHVCEYIPGITLRQWMYDNPHPDLRVVREMTAQLISALRVFQRMGMLHRDLKPENVMVAEDGKIKLIDFGTVRVGGLEEISSPVKDDTPVGSVDYIAPEYLMGETGAHRSDIFSLGVIVYEMLTGKLPYKSRPGTDNRARSFDEWAYKPAPETRKDVPLWLDLTLKKACAPRPQNRYAVLSEFLHDMSQPNQSLLNRHACAPLLEKHPRRFWQGVSALLLLIILLQLAWPYL